MIIWGPVTEFKFKLCSRVGASAMRGTGPSVLFVMMGAERVVYASVCVSLRIGAKRGTMPSVLFDVKGAGCVVYDCA